MKELNSSLNPLDQIDGHDVFNSLFLSKLRDIELSKFEVQFDEDRIDLICKEIYGDNSDDLVPLLILLNNRSSFNKGDIINYVDITTLRSL